MSNNITGAEIFDAGTWNGLTFTPEDIDGIASAFDALNLSGRIPLKFGHKGSDARENDGFPALGWVKKVYRDGNKLKADITDIPTVVYDSIRKGLYKFVSVELLKNVPANTRKIPWVLDAVALLGATAPAVGTLSDLQALTMSRGTGLQCDEHLTFARDPQGVQTHQERITMADDTNKAALQELSDRLVDMQRQLIEMQTENQSLKKERSEFSVVKMRLEALQKDTKAAEVKAHREKIKEKLEFAVKDDRILPAARERFAKAFRIEDDETVMNITLDDVEDFIRENPNPSPKAKPKRLSFVLNSSMDDVPPGTQADQELTLRSFARLRERNIHTPTADDLAKVAIEIVKERPDLGQAYKYLPDEVAARSAR